MAVNLLVLLITNWLGRLSLMAVNVNRIVSINFNENYTGAIFNSFENDYINKKSTKLNTYLRGVKL